MALRNDARRNRERIVAAARVVLQEAGADAPLGLVAKRAGVGRATLYRNFPDRRALLATLMGERLAEFEEMVASRTDGALYADVVLASCREELRFPGLAAVLAASDMDHHPEMAAITARSRRVFAEALRRSIAAGRLRPDLDDDDAVMIASMVRSTIVDSRADPEAAIRRALRALRLLLDGTRSLKV